MPFRRIATFAALFWPLTLAACAKLPPPPVCIASASVAPVAWVVDHGWHTEIGLPADEITGPLGVFKDIFPGVRTLMFGFGKRTFFTARVETPSEWLLGPFPGPGAIQVVGLPGAPDVGYDLPMLRLVLPPDGAARLSAFLWQSLAKTPTGMPRLIAPGLFSGSLFYASAMPYTLGEDCNGWVARAIAASGLKVDTAVIFAGGVMRPSARLAGSCRPL